MKALKIFLPVLFIVLAFAACDKIEAPYSDEVGVVPPPDPTSRKVLLEESTGHLCVNCPSGTEIAQELKETYGDRLILISIHAGFFARPFSDPYDADFRTEAGNTLEDEFNVQANPAGMVNRAEYNGDLILAEGVWTSAVTEVIFDTADVSMKITHTYDEASKNLDISVESTVLKSLEGSYSLCLYVTGDTVSAQKNDNEDIGPTPDILDYHHKHMLINAYPDAWGTPLNGGGALIANEVYTTDIDGTLKEGWDAAANNCSLVAFIYDNATKEVIQAEEVHIIPE